MAAMAVPTANAGTTKGATVAYATYGIMNVAVTGSTTCSIAGSSSSLASSSGSWASSAALSACFSSSADRRASRSEMGVLTALPLAFLPRSSERDGLIGESVIEGLEARSRSIDESVWCMKTATRSRAPGCSSPRWASS